MAVIDNLTPIKLSDPSVLTATPANTDFWGFQPSAGGPMKKITHGSLMSLILTGSDLSIFRGDTSGGSSIVTDLNTAIAALNAAGGGTLVIPRGSYLVDATIHMLSNVTVRCEDGTLFLTTGLGSGTFLDFIGTYGTEVAITVDRQRGDTALTLASALTLSPGDLVGIVGQRNALSSDAGVNWRLGYPTAGTSSAYFAERHIVKSSADSTHFSTSWGLFFDNYYKDNTRETDIHARAATTVAKITPCKDAHWIGGEIFRIGDSTFVVHMRYAYRCTIEQTLLQLGAVQGTIYMRDSFECYGIGCQVFNDPWTNYTSDTGWNQFKIAGCHQCDWIECVGHSGTQPFDFTYFDAGWVNLFCDARSCKTFYANSNAVSTHPGCYGTDIVDGEFLQNVTAGIVLRGRAGKVAGNKLTATASADNTARYGVSLQEAYAQQIDVLDNRIDGFPTGMEIIDGAATESQWTTINNRMQGNTVRNAYRGFRYLSTVGNTSTVEAHLTIADNTFQLINTTFLDLGKRRQGVVVTGNHFVGPLTVGVAGSWIHADDDTLKSYFDRNHFYNSLVTDIAFDIDGVVDTTSFPLTNDKYASYIGDNFWHDYVGSIWRAPSKDLVRYTRPNEKYPWLNEEAYNWSTTVVTDIDTTTAAKIDALISTLKASGIWAKMVIMHLFKVHARGAAIINLIDPATYRLEEQGSLTWSASGGYTGNGTNAWLDLNATEFTFPLIGLNDAHFSVWQNNTAQEAAIGVESGTPRVLLTPRNSGGNQASRLNDVTSATVVSSSATGHHLISRSSSANYQSYRNAVSLGTIVQASTGLDGNVMALLRNGATFSTNQLFAWTVGKALTATEVTTLYNALNTYMT